MTAKTFFLNMTTVDSGAGVKTTVLSLASPKGIVERTILQSPLRDASSSEIPLIDVSAIYSDDAAARKSVAQEIRDAATNTGFFYIKNHGVPSRVCEAAHAAGLAFFRQDMEKKMKALEREGVYDGYRPPQTQRINPLEGVDIREGFSARYDVRDELTEAELEATPEAARKHMVLEHGHWEATQNLVGFKDALMDYSRNCVRLARALTRIVALSLDIPEDAFDDKVKYPDAALLLNYYPPIPGDRSVAPTDPDAQVSIGSHTDFQMFTILWQDNVGGLQVLNRDGQWINAKPIQDTFVVNIADCLQRITNDKYVSTVHRAQNWSGKERISIPLFWGFGLHETYSVVDSCVRPGEEKKYEDVVSSDWLNKRVEDMLNLKAEAQG